MLKILVANFTWSALLKEAQVIIHCDNVAVIHILNTGKARDNRLLSIAGNIWLQCAMYNIELLVKHIPGKFNLVADLLPRWVPTCKHILQLQQLLPNHKWCKVHPNNAFVDTSI